MTVIAFKDGVMCADTHWFTSGQHGPVPSPKIVRAPDGSLWGMAGKLSDGWLLRQWVEAGADCAKPPKFRGLGDEEPHILVARPDGTLWFCRGDMVLTPELPVSVTGETTATTFCEGAMHGGLSAEDAVRLTIKHCIWVGGDVQVERLEDTGKLGAWNRGSPDAS